MIPEATAVEEALGGGRCTTCKMALDPGLFTCDFCHSMAKMAASMRAIGRAAAKQLDALTLEALTACTPQLSKLMSQDLSMSMIREEELAWSKMRLSADPVWKPASSAGTPGRASGVLSDA